MYASVSTYNPDIDACYVVNQFVSIEFSRILKFVLELRTPILPFPIPKFGWALKHNEILTDGDRKYVVQTLATVLMTKPTLDNLPILFLWMRVLIMVMVVMMERYASVLCYYFYFLQYLWKWFGYYRTASRRQVMSSWRKNESALCSSTECRGPHFIREKCHSFDFRDGKTKTLNRRPWTEELKSCCVKPTPIAGSCSWAK